MSDFTAIEVRIKERGVPWEELLHITIDLAAVADTLPITGPPGSYKAWLLDLAASITDGIAIGEGAEVRWNWAGSPQGHYTGGKY